MSDNTKKTVTTLNEFIGYLESIYSILEEKVDKGIKEIDKDYIPKNPEQERNNNENA